MIWKVYKVKYHFEQLPKVVNQIVARKQFSQLLVLDQHPGYKNLGKLSGSTFANGAIVMREM